MPQASRKLNLEPKPTNNRKFKKIVNETKPTIGRKKKLKLHHPHDSFSESEDDIFSVISADNEGSADDECLFCRNSMVADRSGEEWSRCIKCGCWVHNLCGGIEGAEWKTYVCDLCQKKMISV